MCSFLVLLAFGSDPLWAPAGAGGLGAGGVDGVGGSVVLAGLPDDRVVVVLATVVDSDADAEGEGGFALDDVAVADGLGVVGGDAEGGVEPVEGLFGGPFGHSLVLDPVAVVELEGLGG
jgi:hypothetical protein